MSEEKPYESLMWTEKYRPSRLEDLVNQEVVVERLKSMLKSPGDMPHLLFAGPPGTGKTTAALCIARNIMGDYWRDFTLELNASDERGINTVRDRVKTFARYADRRVDIPFRIIILDEADEMCLHPDTKVLVGGLDDLKEVTLRELYKRFGEEPFDIPTLNLRTRQPENDKGRIVPSGIAELYKITFEDGRTVLASSDHPFFIIKGANITTVRTKHLHPGTELADFTNRVLHCYNCGKIFYRHYPNDLYEHHFCSQDCRNSYFGSLSLTRSAEESREIGRKGAVALLQSGIQQTLQHRERCSAIAKRLILEGKIPDPRTWRKCKKGEGVWLGRKLSEEHKRAISEGDRRYFEHHPEVRRIISEKVKQSLAEEDGAYRELVRSGFFKQASVKAYLASAEYWKNEVLPKIFQTVSIAGGALPRVKHSRVKSIEYIGLSEVLNISAIRNRNFFLANGILTHNTSDAQTALRRIMETYSRVTRFILIGNYSSRIIEPIQSRCAIFRFNRLVEEDVVSYLAEICEKEGVKFRPEALSIIYEVTEGDLRHAVNILEAASALGEVTEENVRRTAGISGKAKVADVVKMALEGRFNESRMKLIELTRVYGLSERDFLKYANEALVRLELPNLGEASEVMAKYDYHLIMGAHPEIQLTALLAELGRIGREAGFKNR